MSDFNVRFGAELRKRVRATDESKRKAYPCPKCGKERVRRTGHAMWECRSCHRQFAGGTYALFTPAGEVAERMLADYKKQGAAAKSKS